MTSSFSLDVPPKGILKPDPAPLISNPGHAATSSHKEKIRLSLVPRAVRESGARVRDGSQEPRLRNEGAGDGSELVVALAKRQNEENNIMRMDFNQQRWKGACVKSLKQMREQLRDVAVK